MSVSIADFPQVWQKPSAEELLASLKRLQVDPPVWNPNTPRKIILDTYRNAAQFHRELSAYLSSIIKSNLGWIQDDDEKEALWDQASRRFSERCGRTAMGEITRRWPFNRQRSSPFELVIREPPITGDSLGLKTWGSSYLLAQSLDGIAKESISHLLLLGSPNQSLDVLELGSGTGLLGMAAAAIWQTNVVLTDLPSIGSDNGNAERFTSPKQFKIVLAADPLYDDDHPELLTSAICAHLMDDSDARAVVMVPQRDLITKKLVSRFLSVMAASDLTVIEAHTLLGQDDWDGDGEDSEIECWCAIFGRP
ncbi:hypothetical protein GGR54DRAFT_649679 [Hypoxylon sp. NC1633]|nr:hypothetical protein GGR54DRAFT_649679 [Hypoxylon sp. NC1633]